MLRGKHHIGSAEERIRPGGINSHLIARCGGKINLRAGGATDPVALLYLDTVDKIKLVQIVEQSLGIGRNFSIHWLLTRRTTSLPQRSHTPPAASSLASTHLQEGHQLTAISFL